MTFSHIVMPLHCWSHDFFIVFAWIQSDCLEMEQVKRAIQQSSENSKLESNTKAWIAPHEIRIQEFAGSK